MILATLRGLRDGFSHDEHESGAAYETAARLADALGRVIDRRMLSPRGSALPGEERR